LTYHRKKSRKPFKKTGYRKVKVKSPSTRKSANEQKMDEFSEEQYQFTSFEFNNPNLKFHELPISDNARKLSQEFNYRPYMIERYLYMFGEQGTVNLLEANEIPSNPCIRINTLKAEVNIIINALKSKGYNLKKIDSIPNTYEIISNSIEVKPKIKKKYSTDLDTRDKNETDFTRSAKDLKALDWGKPQKEKLGVEITNSSRNRNITIKARTKNQIGTLGSTHEYLRGQYYIQNKASLFPAFYLNPSEDDIVLDMCAAPGGKTTQIAQLMENNGRIIAAEINPRRIKSLLYNLRRCGIKNTTVLNVNANDLLKYNVHPDKILLDTPCSGEGLIRNDKTRKQSKSPKDITRIMAIQANLLKTAFKLVKPGGFIMYSTCSIAPEENEFVVQSLLDRYPKAAVTDLNDDIGHPGYTEIFGVKLSYDLVKARRFFPHEHDTIGFFYCLIKKLK
jgi:NOL1/NOP2/sun family putative RNA methylase